MLINVEFSCLVNRCDLPSGQSLLKRNGLIVVSVIIAPVCSKLVKQSIMVHVPKSGCVVALKMQHSLNSV